VAATLCGGFADRAEDFLKMLDDPPERKNALNCRHVIHHDLCWNPSTLEQRTGRIDRIGAKIECCGMPIHVYLPYVSATQDEKQFRVVMDRERWFRVVMGEKYKVDLKTTERLAERLPFPEAAASALALHLEVV
jgi:hypothetical protein